MKRLWIANAPQSMDQCFGDDILVVPQLSGMNLYINGISLCTSGWEMEQRRMNGAIIIVKLWRVLCFLL